MTMLNDRQRELILEWIEDRSNAFTIEDLALHYNVHYQTGWRWIKALEEQGFVEKHPLRRNGKDQYNRSSGVNVPPSQRSLKVQRGNETQDLVYWALEAMPSEHVQYVGAALCYLITRSYYAEEPDYQHLRGSLLPADVRAVIAQRLAEMEKDVEVVRQVLSYRLPFVEGSELVQRAGILPVGRSMNDVMRFAQEFSRNMRPPEPEVAQEVYSQSPPVPEPVASTLGQALQETGLDIEDPIVFADAPGGALHLVQDDE